MKFKKVEFIEIGESDKAEYNNFVAAQPSGSFLQSWEWGQWQEKLGRKAFRYFLRNDSGSIAMVIQVIRMPLPLGKFYLYAPYGPVVDLKFNIENLKILVQLLRKKNPDAIFIRLEPKFDGLQAVSYPLLTKSPNIQPAKTLVLDLLKSADELFSAMHHKTRYNIRLSQKHGVEVAADLAVVPGHGLYIQEAIRLIVQTAGRQSFKTFPSSYYEKLVDFFAVHNNKEDLKVYIYKALYQRQLLAAAIMVDFGNTRTYLFGGSSDLHREVMAPYALHFQAIKDAKAAGVSHYDFWGIETAAGETPGFVRFKTGFGGVVCEYSGAYDILNNQIWYKAYSCLRFANRIIKSLRK